MTVDEVLQLMAGMAANKVVSLTWGDLVLHLAPQLLVSGNAASGLTVPSSTSGVVRPSFPVTEQGAVEAVAAIKAAMPSPPKAAEDKLAEMQARTAAARRKVVGGIGANTGKAVNDLYKAVKKTPQRAPTVTST